VLETAGVRTRAAGIRGRTGGFGGVTALASGSPEETAMKLRRAVITAAGRDDQQLPLQDHGLPAGADTPAAAAGVWRCDSGHSGVCRRRAVSALRWRPSLCERCHATLCRATCRHRRGEDCAVSAVQATRESMLPYYGTVGGRHVSEARGLYEVETVVEKPTPTRAEQLLSSRLAWQRMIAWRCSPRSWNCWPDSRRLDEHGHRCDIAARRDHLGCRRGEARSIN